MTDSAAKTIGRDTIEERIATAKANRDRAIETDSRWNWYVLTVPLVAIFLVLQMDAPTSGTALVIHGLALVSLVIAGITGILSQKYKADMLAAAADEDIKIAQLSSDNAKVGLQHLMDKFDEAIETRKANLDSMKAYQKTHYWATSLGLGFLLLQHVYVVFPLCS